jgi:hypothetical protein
MTFHQVLQDYGFTRCADMPKGIKAYTYEGGNYNFYAEIFTPDDRVWITGNPNKDSALFPGGKIIYTPSELKAYLTF